MIVSVKELKKLYESRKTEDDILSIHGLTFVAGYLKYLIMFAESRKVEAIDLTPREEETA